MEVSAAFSCKQDVVDEQNGLAKIFSGVSSSFGYRPNCANLPLVALVVMPQNGSDPVGTDRAPFLAS